MADFEGRRAKLLADLTADAYMIVNLEESDPVSMVYLTGSVSYTHLTLPTN